MGYARKGLRGLGLCFLAVLGLMALAAGAQGQSPGKFLDAGGELAIGTTFIGAQEGKSSLLVAKLNMAIECTTADVEEGVVALKEGGGVGGTAHARLTFLGCIVRSAALVTLGACKVGASKAFVARVKFLANLSSLHGNEPFILAMPLFGEFARIEIENETGKFCSLTGAYLVSGTLALKVLAGLNKTQLVIPYANQALLFDEFRLGTNPAVLDASATIELTGVGIELFKAAFGVC